MSNINFDKLIYFPLQIVMLHEQHMYKMPLILAISKSHHYTHMYLCCLQMTGIVMLVIGILAKISLQQYLKLSTTNFEALPVVQITIGVIIIVVGFLGCCCTCRSYARMLYVVIN